MAKIYTKTGDQGQTGLFAGPRVSKADQRIEAYGEVDELNAVLGCLIAGIDSASPLGQLLTSIQCDLFSIGAELATPQPKSHGTAWQGRPRIAALEAEIDRCDQVLPKLTTFILPGGAPLAAQLHWARTVCRRAERRVVAFQAAESPDPSDVLVYLNRLSDLLFVLARKANLDLGHAEIPWQAN